jgi:hypothetical protein
MKVLGLVSNCKECPNRVYYSGGVYDCAKADTHLPHGQEDQIPKWCPLAEYPSGAIEAAAMARTRLEDFADKANAGQIHYDARELKRRIWAAFADFDAARK